ncbi:type III secretion system export apparatus subunit SctV (plasmid) [Bradyrhizobium sp. 62B]|uniref:type III secretion system export apparatus subunit SctV n=1 Tax=Bradyrhizobium sp. 62B TaxID=2898442 RepID=UPI0025583180|nr:type III secretion system export apparatus subunit SctV [Bradyrhizobium sp. 62B]
MMTITKFLIAGRNDIALVALLVAIVFMIIVPLPPVLMDVMQAFNLGVSALLLIVAVYIKSPLGFTSFPSVLLLTTLFRLSLGIAATRTILLHADAGEVVKTFGDLVIAGNLVVGAVTFLIITIVQYVVITNGCERVAEVSARFTLDMIPGRQMSVDSDLRTGGIDLPEARRRRSAIERESRLFGAMDGAMRFVKGDAVAGLISIVVNIIGGVAIGSLQRGMGWHEALELYAILTVGDGLVGQIPAIFTAITAGVLVTRVAREDTSTNLADAISDDVSAEPNAMIAGSFILVLLGFVPGFPTIIFLILAGAIGGGGWLLRRGMLSSDGARRDPINTQNNIARLGSRRYGAADAEINLVVPLMIDIGRGILSSLAPNDLSKALADVRDKLSLELGIQFPDIALREIDSANPDSYIIRINEVFYGDGYLLQQHVLARTAPARLDTMGIPHVADRPFLPHVATAWVSVAHVDALRAARIPFLEPAQVPAYHLVQLLRRHAQEFIGIQETSSILSRVQSHSPELVKEALHTVRLHIIAEVFQRLISERVSLRNMRAILNAMTQPGHNVNDPLLLTEHVRCALKRQICLQYCVGTLRLPAFILTPELEELAQNAIRHTTDDSYLGIDTRTKDRIIDRIRQAMAGVSALEGPVLLAPPELRPYLRKFLETELNELPVLSFKELIPELAVKTLAWITLSDEDTNGAT